MINAVGEATLQQFVRTSYNAELFDKDQQVQKADKVKEHRPIEKSDNGQRPKLGLQPEDNLKTRNSLEDGQIIVEKYDEDGKLVKKTPPGYLPFGETV